MHVVAIDGVAVNSQSGPQPPATIPVTHFVLPPAARVELIVSAPSRSVQVAQLVTQAINTGPLGDDNPQRPLATIQLVNEAPDLGDDRMLPKFKSLNNKSQRFAALDTAPIAAKRVVYFDENCTPLSTGCTPNQFFMAVVGKPEHIFDPNLPPDIVSTQGTVEHEFHFHQVHFMVKSQDNFEVNGSVQSPAVNGQFLDMIQVPYWDGNPAHPFPSVTVLIDFRGPDVGDFVFPRHILGHEDLGMMNIIQVVGPNAKNAPSRDPKSAEAAANSLEIADRVVVPSPAPVVHSHPHR